MTDPTDRPNVGPNIERLRAFYARRDQGRRRFAPMTHAAERLARERRQYTRSLIARRLDPQAMTILDVGCGFGADLRWWLDNGVVPERLAGCDLIPHRVAAARAVCPGVEIRLSSGMTIPFDDGSFDCVTAATVFSSVLDRASRRVLFAEMERVVRRHGLIVIYDFRIRKPTNADVVAMPRKRLADLGRPPDAALAVSPLIHLVAAGAALHPVLENVAWRIAPRTHLLAWWTSGKKPLQATNRAPSMRTPSPRRTG